MDMTDPAIEAYIRGLGPEAHPVVAEMEARARQSEFPIVDRLVGGLIYTLALLKRPTLVVELGSGFGYSAYWFALAMDHAGHTGRVVLTDRSAENLADARGYLGRAGLEGYAEFREGDAVSIASEYDRVDILFMDHDKARYREAAERLMPRLAPGGMVIADNTLWYGQVVEDDGSPETRGIREFNSYMFGRKDFACSIVPLRDGVLIGLRR